MHLQHRWLFISALALGVTFVLRGIPTHGQDDPPLPVGMMASLFDESDEKTIFAQMQPFVDLVRKQSGLVGEFSVIKSPEQMAAELKSGKLAMGVVLGLDYAWMRESCPDAVPFLIAVNETPTVRACLLVAKDSPAKSVLDLKGKTLALPAKSPRFTKFYLEHDAKDELGKFFQVKQQTNTDAAIEAVVEHEADVTLVTSTALEVYRDRKPGRFNRLKVLDQSMEFPTGAMIYIPGKIPDATVKKFRDAMLTAHETREGRQTLTLWKLTGFQAPPKDFVRQVDELGKKYPRAGK
jgi:ABC-type phosphate/phosphonate transport system substrate-binding protein